MLSLDIYGLLFNDWNDSNNSNAKLITFAGHAWYSECSDTNSYNGSSIVSLDMLGGLLSGCDEPYSNNSGQMMPLDMHG